MAGLVACGPDIAPYEPPPPESEVYAEAPAPDEAGAELHEDDDHDAHDEHGEGHAGEVHEHGAAEMAVTREEDFLTLTLDAPLANFGLSEDKPPRGTKAEDFAEGIAEPLGPTKCEETERSVTSRSHDGHGNMTISVVWRCKKIERIEGLRLNVFTLFPGFEHVDAIYLGPDGTQAADELTAAHTDLDFD
ncbi:MAG: DUF2796 domain-containing protein [Hyphomonas sp.]|nr:DUF2796 domain-containing protein [Hyphomonas sp.]